MYRTAAASASLALLCGLGSSAGAQQYGTLHTATGHTFRPEQRDATDDRVRALNLPDGFEVGVFARDVGNVRMMAEGPDGTIYVTRPGTNDVIALGDKDGDGAADGEPRVVARDLNNVHGIAIRDDEIYLATIHRIYRGAIQPDGGVDAVQTLVPDLPGGGQHARRTLEFGPDGALYLQIGSSCNACIESEWGKAAISRIDPADDWRREVFADGLRNTMGYDWQPSSGAMYGVDNGTDWRGDTVPPGELNLLEQGAHYGWPYCYGDQEPDWMTYAMPPDGTPKEQFCEQRTKAPVLDLPAHSAGIDLVFYDREQFPDAYRGDAFVTLRGSWNREDPVGYKVVRIDFRDGEPQTAEDFLSGFLIEDGRAHFGRVAGLLVAGDGSLLVSEDTNGMIYRISHAGR